MKVGIIGAGTIGEMLARAFSRIDAVTDLYLYDRHADKTEFCRQNYRATSCKDELDCAGKCQLLFLCIKPKDVAACLKKIAPVMRAPKILVSCAAGVRAASIATHTGGFQRVARVMPNTPCLVGKGCVGMWADKSINADERSEISSLMKSFGLFLDVSREEQIDTITAIGGSGPAWVWSFAAALSEGATKSGMDLASSRSIVSSVLEGAAVLMRESGQELADLISAVKTPGGTTEAGFQVLDAKKVSISITDAVTAAIARARELASKN